MSARSVAKALAPPILVDLLYRRSGQRLRFAGHPADWQQAARMSSGYDAAEILERVRRATRAVLAGEARYERDSVLFNEPDFPFPILAGLLRAAAQHGGSLNVVDFGGSLGSTYRQCRPLLDGLAGLQWWVVEQPAFVAAGEAEFSTDQLRFARSLAEVPMADAPWVVLASSVLQYVEDPRAVLQAFAESPARHLIIDRTPLSDAAQDRLCIQHVPPRIYAASYPCRILARARFLADLARHWDTVCEFPCPEGRSHTDDGLQFEFRGLILERRR
jgi:putative methyltransferase (TIGR04325 family)